MCVGIPNQIQKIKGNLATVETKKGLKKIDISLISNVKAGEWILTTQNLAINKVSEKDAQEILNLAKECKHD